MEVDRFDLLTVVGVALLNDGAETVFDRTESVVGNVAIDGGTTKEWTGCINAEAATMSEDEVIIVILF